MKTKNALNEMCLATTFSLYQLSKSPLMPVLRKMESYESFNAFLGDASDMELSEFCPELHAIHEQKLD